MVAVLQVKEYSAVVKVAFQSARSPRYEHCILDLQNDGGEPRDV